MRARACSRCPLCGTPGETKYPELTDALFGAAGRWSLARCPAADCGLLWLDPMPLAEDLPFAYRTYYTHRGPRHHGLARALYERAVDGWFARTAGYPVRDPLGLARLASRAFEVMPARREILEMMTMGLPPVAGGRSLDVGCGDGARVAVMSRLGWRAEGLETDAEAVRRARAAGVTVHEGTLEALQAPEDAFDAVTMAHVIEHVPDPFATLRECRRVLKRGGRIVLVTPNTASLGHRRYGARWRGLEPPRHLHLFDRRTLERAVRQAGLEIVATRTTARMAAVVVLESEAPDHVARAPHERVWSPRLRAAAGRFEREEREALRRDPDAGEELWVTATR